MANMATCPNCGRPVSGRARRCGYCGESLLEDYFSAPGMELGGEEGPSAGATAATVLGSFGAVALIVALVFQLLVLFGFGPEALVPSLDLAWWLRTLAMTVLPVVYLVQQLLLGGHRKSLVFDAVWLFLGMCGLTATLLCYLDRGSAAFYGMTAIPYLLVVGCALVTVACVTAILAYRREEADV